MLIGGAIAVAGLTHAGHLPAVAQQWDTARAWAATVNRPPGYAEEVANGGPIGTAPPAVPGLPAVPSPAVLTTCFVLTPEDVSALLGQQVHLLPGSGPSACHFGPLIQSPEAVWVSVALGPGSPDATLSGVNGTHQIDSGVGVLSPGGDGRTLGTAVSIAIDAGLYPAGSTAPSQLFSALLTDLVTDHPPT